MSNWRLITESACSGAMQMAIDEAMLHARAEGSVPNTLRFYTWSPAAVTIGFFQSMEQEVDVKKASLLGIDAIRRYTGGGAVLHDKELTYSLVVPEKEVAGDIIESYRQLCGCIVEGLSYLGINARFQPINDITVNGKKVSGNAQTRQAGVILQHGTILLEADLDKMFSVLKVPSEKFRGKMIESAKERVTSLTAHMGRAVRIDEVRNAIVKGFASKMNADFMIGGLTDKEKQLAVKLCREKYSSRQWNWMR